MSHKCNTISLDMNAVYEMIKDHYIQALEGVEDRLIQIFQEEILFNGSGRKQWREEASKAIKEISREIAGDYIGMTVGLDDRLTSYAENLFVRIMIAIQGNQGDGP